MRTLTANRRAGAVDEDRDGLNFTGGLAMKYSLKPLVWLLIGLMVGAVGTYVATFSQNRLLAQNNAELEVAVARMEKSNSWLTTSKEIWKRKSERAEERIELLEDDPETLMDYVARQDHEAPTDDQSFPWGTFDDQSNKTQVATTLCERWLGAYMNEDVLPDERLAAYRIEKIELVDKEPTGVAEQAEFVFHVTFSVRPVVSVNQNWAAGDGGFNDGWFTNKGLYAMVLKDGLRYRLRLIGTGY